MSVKTAFPAAVLINTTAAEKRSRPTNAQALWSVFFALLLVGALSLFAAILFSQGRVRSGNELDYALHSPLTANYQADPLMLSLPPVRMEIIAEAFQDRQQNHFSADPMATVMVQLLTPIPSVTPLGTVTPAQHTATPLSQSTQTTAPTPTLPVYTASPTATGVLPTETLAASSTPTVLPTRSPTVFLTRRPTDIARTATPFVEPTSDVPHIPPTQESPTQGPPTPEPTVPKPTPVPPTEVPVATATREPPPPPSYPPPANTVYPAP